jgi:hypothetical protein
MVAPDLVGARRVLGCGVVGGVEGGGLNGRDGVLDPAPPACQGALGSRYPSDFCSRDGCGHGDSTWMIEISRERITSESNDDRG